MALENLMSYVDETRVMKTVKEIDNPDEYQLYVYCVDTSESMSQECYKPVGQQHFLPYDSSQIIKNRLGQKYIDALKSAGFNDEMVIYLNLEIFEVLKGIYDSDGHHMFMAQLEEMILSGQSQLRTGISRKEIVIDVL